MGLDLMVEGQAKAGHEAEWRTIVQRSFDNKSRKGDEERFLEISIPAFEQVGAPRVGLDPAADAWIIETRGAKSPEEIATALADFHGHYALPLVQCDGLPKFTRGAADGIDETSFRGKFLEFCEDALPFEVIANAWEHKFPEDAVVYGKTLLSAADQAEAEGPLPEAPPPKRGFFAQLFPGKQKVRSDEFSFDEQLDIVRTAGKWYIFWGERENAIRAWY